MPFCFQCCTAAQLYYWALSANSGRNMLRCTLHSQRFRNPQKAPESVRRDSKLECHPPDATSGRRSRLLLNATNASRAKRVASLEIPLQYEYAPHTSLTGVHLRVSAEESWRHSAAKLGPKDSESNRPFWRPNLRLRAQLRSHCWLQSTSSSSCLGPSPCSFTSSLSASSHGIYDTTKLLRCSVDIATPLRDPVTPARNDAQLSSPAHTY